jgi:hypothetical protein
MYIKKMKSIAFYVHNHESTVTKRFSGVLKEFEKTGRTYLYRLDDLEKEVDDDVVLAVWENTSTKAIVGARRVDIYNHLSAASTILGDKANLAILTKLMTRNTLKSHVFSSGVEFMRWCRRSEDVSEEKKKDDAEFVAKIPQANSGSGIWILSQLNRIMLAPEIVRASNSNKIVIQEYVRNPLLRNSRKMQFRVYFIVKGDLSCWICRHGLLQVCNKPFQLQVNKDSGDEVHVTNVCRNKHDSKLFQEEKPCDLPKTFPKVFKSMCEVLVDMIRSASPFLSVQRSSKHFEYVGVDFLADADTRQAYLIECNCPPNNTGSISAEPFHHRVWVDMMKSVVLMEDDDRPSSTSWWMRIDDEEEGKEEKSKVMYSDDGAKLSSNMLRWLLHRRKKSS